MFYRFRGRALLLVAFAGPVLLLWPRPSLVGQPIETLPDPRKSVAEVQGAASCSSVACHNFNGAKGSSRSEFSTWSGDDKHSKAFAVLHNDRSTRIVRNLYGDKAKHATEQALCLKCHATNDGLTHNVSERFSLADGVGCEACHGPAHKYFTAHYQNGFKELSPEVKEKQYGLRNTKDLVKRTQLCITCHVGDANKEVNHDLIAAGHPRLNFEMAGYHGIYHKHWTDDAEKARHPDFYARIWLTGQLVTAKAAVDLLESRAHGSQVPPERVGKPWPEFSEYACYACHKDVKVDSPTQRSDYYKTRHPGSYPFGTWYLTAVPSLIGDPGYITANIVDELATLRKLMESPAPDAAKVEKEAQTTSKTLDAAINRLAEGRPLEAGRISNQLRKYVDDFEKNAATLTWDEATQRYLAIAAFTQALNDMGTPTLVPGKGRDELLSIKNRLKGAFPPDYDSPKGYNPLADPKGNLPALADLLKSLRTHLGK